MGLKVPKTLEEVIELDRRITRIENFVGLLIIIVVILCCIAILTT